MPYSFATPPQNDNTVLEIAKTFEQDDIITELAYISSQQDKVCPTTSSNREGRQTGSGTK